MILDSKALNGLEKFVGIFSDQDVLYSLLVRYCLTYIYCISIYECSELILNLRAITTNVHLHGFGVIDSNRNFLVFIDT